MKRTGQVSVLEQTVLFGAGLAIALGFLLAFQSVESGISQMTQKAETTLIAKYLAAQTVSLAQSGVEGTVRVDIPETISGNQYGVRLDDNGVNVITTGAASQASVHGLGATMTMTGNMVSRNQPAVFSLDGNTITMEDSR